MPVGQAVGLLILGFDCFWLLAAEAVIDRCSEGKGRCRIVDDTKVGTVRGSSVRDFVVTLTWPSNLDYSF